MDGYIQLSSWRWTLGFETCRRLKTIKLKHWFRKIVFCWIISKITSRIILIQVQTGPGAHPTSYTMGTRSFSVVKRPGRDVDHPPPSSAEVKEIVEPYLYSPSRSSWPVLGRSLPLPLLFHYRYHAQGVLSKGQLIIIIIFINCHRVVTRWQWLFYMYTKYEIGY